MCRYNKDFKLEAKLFHQLISKGFSLVCPRCLRFHQIGDEVHAKRVRNRRERTEHYCLACWNEMFY